MYNLLDTLAIFGRMVYACKLAYRCSRQLYSLYNFTDPDNDGHNGPDL